MGKKGTYLFAAFLIACMLLAVASGLREKWAENGESWTDPKAWTSPSKAWREGKR